MPGTLRSYREATAQKVSGFYRGTVSIDPDASDPLAQRSILSAELFDADKGSKGLAGQFAWVGKYRDQRRVRENGYRNLQYAVFIAPTSGTYTMTFYGFGTTAAIAAAADAATVAAAIQQTDSGLTAVSVAGLGTTESPFVITLPDVIDVEATAGTMLAQGAIGAVEVNRGFSMALRRGDEFELSGKIPILDYDNVQGLNTLINMALKRMWFIDNFPITPVMNSRGIQTYYGLSDYNWLVSENQIIALYNATLWTNVATLTPPASGVFTMQYRTASTTYITGDIAFDATGAQIQTAIDAAGITGVTVTPTGASGTFTLTVADTYYATPSFTTSSGTVVNNITFLESPSRYSNFWNFRYDAETPYIDNYLGQEGHSFLIEAYRQAHTWICPQIAYGTPGTLWESSTDGLYNDYDMAMPSVEDVAAVAYELVCRQLASVGPGHETDYWKQEAKEAARIAAAIKFYDLPMDTKPRGGLFNNVGAVGSKGYWGRY